jgi:hypothetical protein
MKKSLYDEFTPESLATISARRAEQRAKRQAQQQHDKVNNPRAVVKRHKALQQRALADWFKEQATALVNVDTSKLKQERRNAYIKWGKKMFGNVFNPGRHIPASFETQSLIKAVSRAVKDYLASKNVDVSVIKESKVLTEKSPVPLWQVVCESKDGKNLHLEHIEDMIFDRGYSGAVSALTFIDNIVDVIEQGNADSEHKITVKWDGAPAVFVGTDPSDGKFFVGTKGVFAKNPKLIKSTEDLDELYGDKPGLRQKLMYAFTYLKELGIDGVLQGDLMFIDSDLEEATVGGEPSVVFTPNTISYVVPKDSALGRKIKTAKIGIVFHTGYTGSSLESMNAEFGVDVSPLKQSSNVWFDDATYKDLTGVATLTNDEQRIFNGYITKIGKLLQTVPRAEFDVITNPDVAPVLKVYMNSRVRSGETVGDPKAFIKGFYEFYKSKLENEIAKLKTGAEGAAGQRRLEMIRRQEEFVNKNLDTLVKIITIYKAIIQLKLMLLKKLQKIDNIGTFFKTDNGYEVANPEGFVAISKGNAVKLVDRLEFSKQNFTAQKSW